MRFIPTAVHGVMDYLLGLLLIASPWLLNFATGGPAMWVPIVIGAAVIIYSAFTAYELGLVPSISMSTHLILDAAGGLLLAISPWIFQFQDVVWMPHLILGLAEIAAAATTQTVPGRAIKT